MTAILAVRTLLWLICAGAAIGALLLWVAIFLDHSPRSHPAPAEEPPARVEPEQSLFAHPRAFVVPPYPDHEPDTTITTTEEAA
jgi:hypothetical protein